MITNQISREMTIEDILRQFPGKGQLLAQEITSSGVHCMGCQAETWKTLEAGMLEIGSTDEEIDTLVSRLNAILTQTIDTTTISLTPRAAEKYLHILKEEGKEGWGLRFGDRAAGCSGFEYTLDYSEKADPEDTVFTSEGVQIHVHSAFVERLMGSVIDYVDGLNGSGFKITNPNVKGCCGCGKSQSY